MTKRIPIIYSGGVTETIGTFVCDGTCAGTEFGDCSHQFSYEMVDRAEDNARMWQRRALAAEKSLRELQNKVKSDDAKRARKDRP